MFACYRGREEEVCDVAIEGTKRKRGGMTNLERHFVGGRKKDIRRSCADGAEEIGKLLTCPRGCVRSHLSHNFNGRPTREIPQEFKPRFRGEVGYVTSTGVR
jgi:hypothetical protein